MRACLRVTFSSGSDHGVVFSRLRIATFARGILIQESPGEFHYFLPHSTSLSPALGIRLAVTNLNKKHYSSFVFVMMVMMVVTPEVAKVYSIPISTIKLPDLKLLKAAFHFYARVATSSPAHKCITRHNSNTLDTTCLVIDGNLLCDWTYHC